MVAQQKQKTEKIHKETVLQNEVMDAERKKEVSRINNEQKLNFKEHEKNVSSINNTINTLKENTWTDIERSVSMLNVVLFWFNDFLTNIIQLSSSESG